MRNAECDIVKPSQRGTAGVDGRRGDRTHLYFEWGRDEEKENPVLHYYCSCRSVLSFSRVSLPVPESVSQGCWTLLAGGLGTAREHIYQHQQRHHRNQ